MPEESQFTLEEYKQVRAELMERERSVGRLSIFAVAANAAIASVLLTLATGPYGQKITQSEIYPYFFLMPLTISIPTLFIIAAHRNDLFRAGAYIQVFFEEKGFPLAWQTRIGQFRRIKKGEPLDAFLLFFAVIFVASGLLFALYLNTRGTHFVDILIFLSISLLQLRACRQYARASQTHREECIES